MRKRIIALFMCVVLTVAVFADMSVYAVGAESVTANDTNDFRAFVKVLPGQGTTLYANVKPAEADVTYKWYDGDYNGSADDPDWNLIPNETDSTLVFDVVQHSGTYTCRVQDEYGNCFTLMYFVTVDNNFNIIECRINGNPGTRYAASVGENVTLSVLTEANDVTDLKYEWYILEYDANWNENLTLLPFGEPEITVKAEENTEYRCVASDRYGNKLEPQFTVGIENHLTAYAYGTQSSDVHVAFTPGEAAELKAIITADDLTDITAEWDNWDNVGVSDLVLSEDEESIIATFTINKINESTSRTCRIHDKYGNETRVIFFVDVNHFAVTTGYDNEAEIWSGVKVNVAAEYMGNTTLKVYVSGDDLDGVSYSWSKGHLDEWGNNYTSEYYLDEGSNSLSLSEIRSSAVYCCSVSDAHNNQKSAWFIVEIDNNLKATVKGKDVTEDTLYVSYGEDVRLEVEATANYAAGISYRWEENENSCYPDSPDSPPNYLDISNISERRTIKCIVSDNFDNKCTVTFFIVPQFNIYAGNAEGSEISGLNDCFYARAWKGYDLNQFYITPLKSKEEALAEYGINFDEDPLYIWITFTLPSSSFNEQTWRDNCAEKGILAGKAVILENGNVNYTIGVKLWTEIDIMSCQTTFFCGGSREEYFRFVDGPASYGGFRFYYSGAGVVDNQYSDDYFNVSRNHEYSEYFRSEFDKETATWTITPLITYQEFLYKVKKKNGYKVGFDCSLSIDDSLFSNTGESIGNWTDVTEATKNACSSGAGGGPGGMGCGIFIYAWTDNDLTFEAYGTDPEGKTFTQKIRVITLASPVPVDKKISGTDVRIDENVKEEDIDLAQHVADSIRNSDNFGIADAINDAAAYAVDSIISTLSEEELDSTEKMEVTSHFDVSVLELSSDDEESKITLAITPKYDVIRYDKDGTTSAVGSGELDVKEDVDIAIYVGTTFGENANVTVVHTKEDGTLFQYSGTVDPDGYLRFKNTHGFSSFDVLPGELSIIPQFKSHTLLLSGDIGVNFYMDLSMLTEEERNACYMEFTINGETTTDPFDPESRNPSTGEYYGFTCYVNSVQMADEITAVLYYGENKKTSKTYSVADYVSAVQGNPQGYSTNTIKLVNAIADYGSYVQPFLSNSHGWIIGWDHDEMTAASAYGTEELEAAREAVAENAIILNKEDSQIDTATFSLYLDSETSIRIYLRTKDNFDGPVSATLGDSQIECIEQNDGRYRIEISNIPAHELAKTFDVKISAGGEGHILVSALSYVHAVMNANDSSSEAKDAVASLYYYYAASKAYKENPTD